MNKKLFFGMFAAATMLFATSCSNDEMDGLKGNESVVSFTLEQPGISTRAYSDGLKATNLTYAVYETESGTKVDDGEIKGAFSGKQATVTFTLEPNKTYDFIFWADNENAPYTFNATDKTITVDYTGVISNDEERDAFYFVKTGLEVLEESVTETITLTRPFAQLNIGSIGNEVIGFTPAKSKVSVSNVGNVLNLATGVVTGQAEVPFGVAEFPQNEAFPVEGVDNYYSMNYLLVGADKELTTVNFTLLDANDVENSRSFENIPVRRNYRTNIYGPIGNILSNSATFTCTIDEQYETPNYFLNFTGVKVDGVTYETIEEAFAAAGDGSVLELGVGEYDLPHNLYKSGRPRMKLTIKGLGDESVMNAVRWSSGATQEPTTQADNVELILSNLTYQTNNDWLTAGFTRAYSVTFDNCKIIGGYHSQGYEHGVKEHTTFKNCRIDPLDDYIYVYGANCVFDGCTFTSSEGKAIQAYTDANNAQLELTVKNCTFTAAKVGKKSSGAFVTAVDINSHGSTFDVNISNSTAEGYGIGEFSKNSLWDIKGGKEYITVTVDGNTVHSGN